MQKDSAKKLPAKHHYIPQFYLKGFSIDGSRLHVFDKKATNKDSRFRYQTTEHIAYEKHLYTYRTVDKGKETMEDIFCQVEGMANIVIKKLDLKEEITPLERGHLALFVSFLWFRTPSARDETLGAQEEMAEKVYRMAYRFPQQKEKIRDFFKKQGRPMDETEIDDMIDFAVNPKRSKFVIEFPPEHWIKQMLEMSNEIYTYLAHCKWEVKHSIKKFAFITSDNPVLLIPSEKPHPFYGVGLLTPGVKKIVPLSASMYLVMHEPQDELEIIHTVADKEFYRKVNDWTMKNAERFVFSPDLGKIEKIVKTKPDIAKPRGKRYRIS